MTKLIQSALVAVAIVAGASAAMAQSYDGARAQRSGANEDPYAGHSPNSPQGNRAYWDYQGRHGN
jgi:hypothetical protein